MSRVYSFDGENGIPANHIVSVPPEQQGSHDPSQAYLMAGWSQDRARQTGSETDFAKTNGSANSWAMVKSPRVGYPPFNVVSWMGPDRPNTPLYGLIGTAEEGMQYEIPTHRFYREVADGSPSGAAPYTGAGSTGTLSYTVGGTTTVTPGAPMTGKEMTLPQGPHGPIWYARTERESASAQGPHPGVALAGPNKWNSAMWGTAQDNGFPMGIRLITMDDPDDVTTVRPASQEYQAVLQRAAAGDPSAVEALNDLGIQVPAQQGGIGSIFGF